MDRSYRIRINRYDCLNIIMMLLFIWILLKGRVRYFINVIISIFNNLCGIVNKVQANPHSLPNHPHNYHPTTSKHTKSVQTNAYNSECLDNQT